MVSSGIVGGFSGFLLASVCFIPVVIVLLSKYSHIIGIHFIAKTFIPVDISGTVVGESPDCLLLSGTVLGENPDHVCWDMDMLLNNK